MKKLTVVFLCICLCIGVFASCGGNTNTSSVDTQSKTDNPISSEVETTSSKDTTPTLPPLDEGIEVKVPILDKDLANTTRVKILPLGDSFTAIAPAAYRFYLYQMLYENGNFVEFVGSKSTSDKRLGDYYTRFEGTGGHKTTDGLKVYNEKIAGKMKYDVMVLFYGINDVGTNEAKLPEFKTNYSALLDAILADNPTASIFAVGSYYDGAANTTKELVDTYKAKGMDITYVNVFQQGLVDFTYENDYLVYTCERRHLGDSGNYKFAKAVFDAMKDRVTEINETAPEKKNLKLPVAVTEVKLSSSDLTLKIGEAKEISYEIAPANADTKSVIWHTSNEAVATVNEYGDVTAVGAGETNITAVSLDGKAYNVCKVTVSSEEFNVPMVESAMVFEDDFSTAAKWSAGDLIGKGGYQVLSFEWGSQNTTVSTNDSFDLPANFTFSFDFAQSGSADDIAKCNTIELGEYKLTIYNSAAKVVLSVGSKEVARFEGRTRPFYNGTYTLSVVDGKAYVIRDTQMLMTADVSGNASGNLKITFANGGSYVSEFDNIKITK